MKNLNGTELSRVKIPKLNYASNKKALWLKEQGGLSSTPIILPPLPSKLSTETPRHATKTAIKTTIHKSLLADKADPSQKRKLEEARITPRVSKPGAAIEFNVTLTVKQPEVPNNIRKKIEQYRKWHDSQRRKTPSEAVHPGGADNQLMTSIFGREKPKEIDLLPGKRETDEVPKPNSARKKVTRVASTDIAVKNTLNVVAIGRASNSTSPASIPTDILRKKHSASTWRTWRDVNDSYCYTDVKEYIKENELMDDEKERIIRQWVMEVYTAVYVNGPSEPRYDIDPSTEPLKS